MTYDQCGFTDGIFLAFYMSTYAWERLFHKKGNYDGENAVNKFQVKLLNVMLKQKKVNARQFYISSKYNT